MKSHKKYVTAGKQAVALFVVLWLSVLSPVAVFAQENVDATGTSTGAPAETGAPADTGAPSCTGAGCDQGLNQGSGQGVDQGSNQGGPTLSDLGGSYDESGNLVLPEGVVDTRQGAAQGSTNGVTTTNSNTGAGSDNSAAVDTSATGTTGVSNTATDTTIGNATGTTGNNTSSSNTGNTGITSGTAGIGVTQVKNDNTAIIGGSAGLTTTGYNGDYVGDINLGFGPATASLTAGGSVRAVNETTGSDSNNSASVTTNSQEINEVQNDGRIDNILDLAAITGRNEADKNTGTATIATGDADVAATLVNLLNTTVINGDIWVTVADIFGNLAGDIYIPDFANYLAAAAAQRLAIDAANEQTGANSDNSIAIDVTDRETTRISNDADINTVVNAEAITGQNDANANTGGASITTGDGKVSAANVTVANTTIEGGAWGLFIVNALNGWLGFLVGDNGQVRALSQDETLHEIEARNQQTGANSDNAIAVDATRERETTVNNDAVINNEINAAAITGQNEASKNTGAGLITTGDANVQATTVNIANTTVKDGSLFIAVVNIFGDWLGDIFFGGSSLTKTAAVAATSGGGTGTTVDINASNSETGENSDNSIDVNYDRERATSIDNTANIRTKLNATVDTGGNTANRNTLGAGITTGDGFLALHSRTAANLTGIAANGGLGVTIHGLNDTTGAESENTIRAKINDERVVTINNFANISTLLGSLSSPALVNTGGNTANQNTLGATIVTGDANAQVAIQNVVNKVIAALGGNVNVDAEFINRLTGAISENLNELDVDSDNILTVLNDAFINNLLHLLLNTGDNAANENTGGASIVTGGGCVDISIANQANKVTFGGTTSADIDNDSHVQNDADVSVQTGSNETERNTGESSAQNEAGNCEKEVAAAPEVTPPPAVGGGVTSEGGNESKGEGPRVAAIMKKVPRINGGAILKRFPVAGGEDMARLFQGRSNSGWATLLLMSAALIGFAWRFDANARRGSLSLLAHHA